MKIRITYDDSVNLECELDEVAEKLAVDATDDAIRDALYEDVGNAASEREWPSFAIDRGDMSEAVAAVRAEIEKRRKPAKSKRGGK